MSRERARPWQNPTPLRGFEPQWLGQFDTFNDWVDHASRALTGFTGSVGEKIETVCIDVQGRRCNVGKDFARARDEDAFPIRYFLTGAVNHMATPFQDRVQPWMLACFGEEISNDRLERGDRLLEEVLELLQSGDYPPERVAALTGYVFGRPKGERVQEVGGVMVTIAAYCLAHDLDMHVAGEMELERIWTKVEAIRAKRANKPVGSALPVAAPPTGGIAALPGPLPWSILTSDEGDPFGAAGAWVDANGEVIDPHEALAYINSRPTPDDLRRAPGQAATDVLAERRRQIEAEGWTPEHDDEHSEGEIAKAAATYALAAAISHADRAVMDQFGTIDATPWPVHTIWPWSPEWWKPKSRRRDLVKAGALILAEIERLDRARQGGAA